MKKLIAIFTSGILCSFSMASQAQTISDALKDCGQVQNSLKRLVCYDKIVNDLNRYGGLDDLMSVPAPLPANGRTQPLSNAGQQPPVSQTPQPQPRAQQQPATDNHDDFGMESRQEHQVDKIYATVVSIAENARKKRIFTLDNGQVWRETEGSSFQIRENETIYIERGAIGSFHLSRDDVNRRMRVKRVK